MSNQKEQIFGHRFNGEHAELSFKVFIIWVLGIIAIALMSRITVGYCNYRNYSKLTAICIVTGLCLVGVAVNCLLTFLIIGCKLAFNYSYHVAAENGMLEVYSVQANIIRVKDYYNLGSVQVRVENNKVIVDDGADECTYNLLNNGMAEYMRLVIENYKNNM